MDRAAVYKTAALPVDCRVEPS